MQRKPASTRKVIFLIIGLMSLRGYPSVAIRVLGYDRAQARTPKPASFLAKLEEPEKFLDILFKTVYSSHQ